MKILIIEDDKFLLKLYSDQLKHGGFEVSGVLTGEEGLHRVSKQKPDLILLDLLLPKKNGFEILSDLKLNPKTKGIPVMILTNLAQETDVQKGMELGAASYLIKTEFSINQLGELVKECIVKAKLKEKKS